ncbi:MAG: hypothetical protein ABSC89_14140 [Verrucomicrobiota bacterium]|jgi:hypothetical protein
MNPFCESFQKELGKGFAQLLLGAAMVLFAILAGMIGGDKQLARILLICLSGIAGLLLASGLLFHYFSRRYIQDPSWPATATLKSDPKVRICYRCYHVDHVALQIVPDKVNDTWGCNNCGKQLPKP